MWQTRRSIFVEVVWDGTTTMSEMVGQAGRDGTGHGGVRWHVMSREAEWDGEVCFVAEKRRDRWWKGEIPRVFLSFAARGCRR